MRAAGAGRVCFNMFLSFIFNNVLPFFLPLSGRRPDTFQRAVKPQTISQPSLDWILSCLLFGHLRFNLSCLFFFSRISVVLIGVSGPQES